MSVEATMIVPRAGLTREECRLVTCPQCGAAQASWCNWPNKTDRSVWRPRSRIHERRIQKAIEYRGEGRI